MSFDFLIIIFKLFTIAIVRIAILTLSNSETTVLRSKVASLLEDLNSCVRGGMEIMQYNIANRKAYLGSYNGISEMEVLIYKYIIWYLAAKQGLKYQSLQYVHIDKHYNDPLAIWGRMNSGKYHPNHTWWPEPLEPTKDWAVGENWGPFAPNQDQIGFEPSGTLKWLKQPFTIVLYHLKVGMKVQEKGWLPTEISLKIQSLVFNFSSLKLIVSFLPFLPYFFNNLSGNLWLTEKITTRKFCQIKIACWLIIDLCVKEWI